VTTTSPAWAGKLKDPALTGNLKDPVRTKQLVEGEYSQNMEAASYFQQGVTRYNRVILRLLLSFFARR
jgi:hypothetical protein